MEAHEHLRLLLDLAEEAGIAIRRAPSAADSADHPGGALVRVGTREMLFLDPTAAPADQIAVVAAALRGREEIENRYLPPELRQLIEEIGTAQDT